MDQLLCFRVADEVYGLEIDAVQEVVAAPQVNPVCRAPQALQGMINLHGSPRAVLNLPLFLGFDASPLDPRLIALTPGCSGLALAVTELLGIRPLDPDHVLPHPEERPEACLRAVLQMEDAMINLLHLERLRQRLEQACDRQEEA